MPIILDPLSGGSLSEQPFTLATKEPVLPQIFGEEIHTRRHAIRIASGASNILSTPLFDEQGNPILIDDNLSFKCRFVEAVKKQIVIEEVSPSAIDPVYYHIVQFTIPTSVSSIPGIYIASIGIFDVNVLRETFNIWIYNEPSPWVPAPTQCQLPTIDEIRGILRDSSPIENEILNNYQFGLEEICQAAVETVHLWNDTPPFIGDLDTRNFASRHIFLYGIRHYLFEILLEWYRKNRLPYSAGGVSVDDMNKLQEYIVASQKQEQDLKLLIQTTKSSINLSRAFGKIA